MSHNRTKWILIFATLINLLLLGISYFAIIFSVMMFDNSSGEGTRMHWFLFGATLLLPVLCVLAIILSWIAYARQQESKARRLCLLPLVSIGGIILAWTLLNVTCNGTYNCVV